MKQPTALVTASHSVSPSRSPVIMVPVTNLSALADIVDKTIATDDKKTSNTSTSTDNVSCASVIVTPVDIHDDIKCEQPINNPVVNINTPSSIVVDQSSMLILPPISDMLLTATIITGTLAGHIQSSCATLVTPNGPMFSIHDIAIDTPIITAASNPVRMPSVIVPPFYSTPEHVTAAAQKAGQLSVPSSTLASISTSESSFGQTATLGGSMRLALVSYAAINLARRLLMRVIVLGSWPTILLGSGLPEVSLLLRVMRHLVLLALWTGFLYYRGYQI